ncbi:MAG: alpha/beta hydrolase [Planctomycetota bacterium]
MSEANTPKTARSIELEGARLAWTESGPEDARTALLVHGFPLHGEMWEQQRVALAEAYRVIVPDLRGYGGSTLGGWPVEGPDREPTLTRYAHDLAAVLDAAEADRVVIVGFSMGGYIALEMLRQHPDCLTALAMLDSRVAADDEAGHAGRLKMADNAAAWGSKRIAGMMRPKLLASEADESAVAQTLGQIEAADPAAIAASQRAMAARPDSSDLIAAYDGPLLAMGGEHDEISPPAEMRAFAENAKHGRFVEIAGAGHMAPIEKPEAVTAALREWLDTLP